MKKRKAIPAKLRQKVYEVKGTLCFCCGVDILTLPKIQQVLDHVELHTRGGKDSVKNLRPACRRCNATRHAMDDDELREYIEKKDDSEYMCERRREKKEYYRRLRQFYSDAAKRGWITRRDNAQKHAST
jgi:hypothetical protein